MALLPLVAAPGASAAEEETCFFRQHRGAAVNARQALSRAATATATAARLAQSEQACVRACCATAVKPGGRWLRLLGPGSSDPFQMCLSL